MVSQRKVFLSAIFAVIALLGIILAYQEHWEAVDFRFHVNSGSEWATVVSLGIKVFGGFLILWAWLLERKVVKLNEIIERGALYLPFRYTAPDLETRFTKRIMSFLINHAYRVEAHIEKDPIKAIDRLLDRGTQIASSILDTLMIWMRQDYLTLEGWYLNYFHKEKLDRRLIKRIRKEAESDSIYIGMRGMHHSAETLIKVASWDKRKIESILKRVDRVSEDIQQETSKLKNGNFRTELEKAGADPSTLMVKLNELSSHLSSRVFQIQKDAIPIVMGAYGYLQSLRDKIARRRTTLYVLGFTLAIMSDIPKTIVSLLETVPAP